MKKNAKVFLYFYISTNCKIRGKIIEITNKKDNKN